MTVQDHALKQDIGLVENGNKQQNSHIYNKIKTMKDLKQLIRESINEYINGIDEAGENAALEAKMNATTEAIELREKKMKMEGLDEAYHDMLDKGKMKELSSEIKALKKSLAKYEKQLDKLKNKGAKKVEIVDENEKFGPSGKVELIPQLKKDYEDEDDDERYDADGNQTDDGSYNADGNLVDLEREIGRAEYNRVDESFLHMQKLAGLITEAQYQAKKK